MAETELVCLECGMAMAWTGDEGQTLLGYASPDGHDHDDNCLYRSYRCANGHERRVYLRRTCPVPGCDWVGKATCRCHVGLKVNRWPEAKGD